MKTFKNMGGARFGAADVAAAAIMAAALVACTPPYSTEPEQVAATHPSVTYTYQTDQDLLEASQKAATYCGQYQSTIARSGPITSNSDGTNTVSFECVPLGSGRTVATTAPAQPMTYTYYNAQELLQASDQAERTCMNIGKQTTATITTNPDGSKTATFRCVP